MMEGKDNSSCCGGNCANGCGGMCGGKCNCMHHKMFPLLMVVFGGLFLLEAYGQVNHETVVMVWPVLVILGGLTKMFKGMCKCC